MRTVRVKIDRGGVLLELSKWSHTVGENLGDDAAKLRYFVQGLRDAGHEELVMACMDDAWSEILQILSAYTVARSCGCGDCVCDKCVSDVNDNEMSVVVYEATLSFPDNTYPALEYNLNTLCHRYMVQRCRAEWERLTRQDSALAEREAEMCARRLRRETMLRSTPVKLKGWYGYR